jgi:hemerythrin-like domain-containing protein
MDTILGFLGSYHRACESLFASASDAVTQKNWAAARNAFERFQALMARHIEMEENVLFPAFEAHTRNSMGPTQIMRMEHEQIRALIQDMAHAMTANNHSGYLGLSATFDKLMQQHYLNEENMLYPMSDQMLGDECNSLIRSMEAIARSRFT